jgi:hypothetical protein
VTIERCEQPSQIIRHILGELSQSGLKTQHTETSLISHSFLSVFTREQTCLVLSSFFTITITRNGVTRNYI